MTALALYVYGSIALCLLTVALHDIARWASRRPVRIYSVVIDYSMPRHLTYEDGR